MKNPWLTKNPFLSAWLSAANAAAGTARAHATAAAQREIAAAQAEVTRQVVDFWSGRWLSAPPPARRKSRKR